MDKYEKTAYDLMGDTVNGPLRIRIEKALRDAAAEAYEDAAREVECFDSVFERGSMARHGESISRPCAPCNECVKAARLEGIASALRAGGNK